MRWIFALVMAALTVAPTGVVAQAKESLTGRGKLLGWEAVGRLDFGTGFCTGTLIASDIVLTAAHCVHDNRRGAPRAPDRMVFRAGYHAGQALATRKVQRLVIAKGYLPGPDGKATGASISNDVALVQLDSAVSSFEADPFRIEDRLAPGTKVTLVSYGRGRAEALTKESGCALTARYAGGIMGFDCDATFGSSGAPVFVRSGSRFRILSVISAGGRSAAGDRTAFGMPLPALVAELMRELRAERARPPVSAGAKRLSVGQRSAGGARFVRADGS